MKPSAGSNTTPLDRVGRAGLRLLSDERLARIAAGGDRLAFAAIFDRYHQDLYGYCASILRNRDDAADALQNTMLKALRALDGERRQIALRPWLYRIAHNESIELLRAPRSEPAADGEVVSVNDVEGSAATRAHLRTVLGDIQQLPERQRGALVMREMSGLGYAEIGDALETTPAGAKQAVYDARQALHEMARGRESDCATVRIKLSDGDRRVFRARTIRAHLSACADCRTFQADMAARESSLAAFAPALPAAVAAKALHGAVAGGAAGAAASSAAGMSAGMGAVASVPAVSAVAVAVALGAGAFGVHEAIKDDDPRPPAAQIAQAAPDSRTSAKAVERARSGGAVAERARARELSRARAERTRARSGGRDGTGRTTSRRKGKKSESGADSAGLAGTSGTPGTNIRGGASSTGIAPFVRGGREGRGAGGSSGNGNGPVRTGVDGVRGGVEDTVGQVQDALPVPTPDVPAPIVRPPRNGGG